MNDILVTVLSTLKDAWHHPYMQYLTIIATISFLLSFSTYAIPVVLQTLYSICGPQNLKKKYNAKWALVTGGSSGIGKAIVMKLASQGLNVVVAALDARDSDKKMLEDTIAELEEKYNDQEFRAVGVDLSKPHVKKGGYLDKLEKATKDIDVQLIFNNAGFIKTGFFADLPLGANQANYHCNATSAMEITHKFLNKLLAKKLRGCIVFTSSPANLLPCPFSSMYGGTKAFLTEFATSIAPEIRVNGIDVCVIHPSPVASNFYKGTHAIDAIKFFKSTATGPEVIANKALSCIGRPFGGICDQGYYAIGLRGLLKMLDVTFLSYAITRFAHLQGDFKKLKKN